MDTFEVTWSWLLIGVAIALAGVVGVLQPPGHRGTALLALLAGTGVGIGGLALGWASVENGSEQQFWETFFVSSVAGFVTVIVVLLLAWVQARRRPRSEAPPGS
jgi:ABC-type Fe3+ transport system permease subunit